MPHLEEHVAAARPEKRPRRPYPRSAIATLVLRALAPGKRYSAFEIAVLVQLTDKAAWMLCARMAERGDLVRHGTRRRYRYSVPDLVVSHG